MEKKILRILSFLMIAVFAFGVMGLSISAEELDIPVIEEVTEEEMTEEIPEDEVELLVADTTVAALYDGETLVGEYKSFSGAFSAVQNGYTIKLYKDIVGEVVNDDRNGQVNLANQKNFSIDGQGHTWTVADNQKFYIQVKTTVTITNMTLTVTSTRKETNFVVLDKGCQLTLGDGATIRGIYNEKNVAQTIVSKVWVSAWDANPCSFTMLDGSKLENVQVTMDAGKSSVFDMQGGEIAASGAINGVSAGAGTTVKLSGSANVLRPLAYNGAASLSFTNYSGTVYLVPSNEEESVIGTVSGEFTGNVYHYISNSVNPTSVSDDQLVWTAQARINDKDYLFLTAAIEAVAEGETINLLEDITFLRTITMSGGKTFTIDGKNDNGNFTIYENAGGVDRKINVTNSHVIFTNINLRKTSGNNSTKGYAYFLLDTGGKVTLGDYAVVGGTSADIAEYGNGAIIWVQGSSASNKAYFTLNGEGARIEYMSAAWQNGVFGGSTAAEINLLKGEVINCKHKDALIGNNADFTVNLGDVNITGCTSPTVNGTSIAAINITGSGNLGTIKAESAKINFKKSLTYGPNASTYNGGDFTGTVSLRITDVTEPESFAVVEDGMLITGIVTNAADGGALILDANGKLVRVYEAKIGDKGYTTFLSAVSAVNNGETIYILKDLSYTSAVTLGNNKTFTISGDNGDGKNETKHTLKIENSSKSASSMYVNAGTNVTFENIRITGSQEIKHDNGFFGLNGTVTIGDYCEMGGTEEAYMKSINGGVAWVGGSGAFILDGEGAKIEYVSAGYHGNIALCTSTSKAYIKNGTITNCNAADFGQVTSSYGSGNIYITGGSIINNSGYGVYVKQGAGKLEISGDAIIEGNVYKENKSDIKLLNDATIVLAGDFTGRTSIIPAASVFGTLRDTAYTGYENIKSAVNNQAVVLGDDGVILKIPHEAKIGETYYWKLREAADKTGTIEMLADVENWGSHMDVAARSITINGNGHTLHAGPKVASSSQFIFVAFNNGVVNVNNVIFDCQGRPALIAHATGGGTVTATDCTFINGTENDNGVLAVSGGSMTLTNCTIEAGKGTLYGVIVVGTNGNAHDKGKTLTMTNCTVTGNTGNKPVVIVNGNGVATLEDVEITGNTATESALYVAEGGTVVLGGETVIAENTVNITNEGKLTLASDFAGNLGFYTPGTIEVEEDLTSFAKVNTLFLDTDASKYPDITTDNKIKWELIPTATVEADAGWYYKDNNFTEKASGVVRFLTTFTAAPSVGCVESYGTYALGTETKEFAGIKSVKTFEGNEGNCDNIAKGKAYIVDVVGIPVDKTGATIYGQSFVKLKNIVTPVYFDMASKTIDENAKELVVAVEA